MKNLQQQVRHAFDSVELPEEVKLQTLSSIEAARAKALHEHEKTKTKQSTIKETKTKYPAVEQADTNISSQTGATPPSKAKHSPLRRTLAVAACLLLVLTTFGGYTAYATPVTYVDIEATPAIELSINRFGRVVDAKALTDEAQAILDQESLLHKSYESALAQLLANTQFQEAAEAGSYLEVNVVSKDSSQASHMENITSSCLTELPCESHASLASEAERLAAQEAGMSVGRYRAAQEAMAKDTSLSLEDCKNLSMKELRLLGAEGVEADLVQQTGKTEQKGQHNKKCQNW